MVVNRDGRGAEGKRDACERQEYSFAIFRLYQILGGRIDNDKNMRATKIIILIYSKPISATD